MTDQLANDVAVVTGAASGIGRTIATRFVAEGATVVIADVNVEDGTAVRDSLREAGGVVEFVKTDISNVNDVRSLFDAVGAQYGGLDILVNNAGGAFGDDNLHRIDEETWDRNVDVNLKGPFLCTKHALPLLIEGGGGRIVTMSSINGLIGLGLTSYSAAKGGIIPMMKLVASQYGRHGVRANVICPGEIATDVHEYSSASDEVREEWLDQFALGRFGSPEEVASVALFLASEESSYVTGTKIVVDGGMINGRNQRLQEVTYDVGDLYEW